MSDLTRILRLGSALALSGALLVASPVVTAGMFSAGDDEIPGVSTISPAEGEFADTDDVNDVFRIHLLDGEILRVVLNGSAQSYMDLALLSPDTESLDGALAIASADCVAGAYPVRLTHKVSGSGTYYLDVFNHAEAYAVSPDYMVFWSTDWPGDKGELPGAALHESPFTGMLDTDIDQDDVYSVYLAAGEQLDLQLDSDAGADFELYLFGPGATSVDNVGDAVAYSDAPGNQERITYTAPVSGAYSVNAYTRDGSGSYRVTWAKKAAVSTPVVASSMALGHTYQASGSISLRRPAAKSVARLQAYRLEAGTWVLRATTAASLETASGRTRYTGRLRLPYRGKWRIRAYHRDASHAAAYSAFRYVTVR